MDGVNERQPNQIEINEPLARLFSKLCRGNLSPMAGIIGGIVAQVKLFLQFFYGLPFEINNTLH